MKRSLAYITAAWRGDPAVDLAQAAHYCRVVYDAGYSPICPMLYLPLFLNDEMCIRDSPATDQDNSHLFCR